MATMTINGVQTSFDMDVRTDYSRFVKAYQDLERKRKNTKGTFDDNDMEGFLKSCLKREEIDQILADGRISSLAKSFAEFFNQAVDQLDAVLGTYQETAELIADTNVKMQSLKLDLDPLKATLAEIEPERPNTEE